jgi:hypothetical protein
MGGVRKVERWHATPPRSRPRAWERLLWRYRDVQCDLHVQHVDCGRFARWRDTGDPGRRRQPSDRATPVVGRACSRSALSPLMAQMRSADRIQKCLLFGVDRTYRRHYETDAFDPFRTSASQTHCFRSQFRGQDYGQTEVCSCSYPNALRLRDAGSLHQ